jgi:putative tryptophan/tyrosine transport system substrate-binding protein
MPLALQSARNRPDGLLVPGDTFLVSQRSRIAQFAIENKLPSVYTFREHVEAGGLIAYPPNCDDLFRRAANYVDKVLKGTKPDELPIEQPMKSQTKQYATSRLDHLMPIG